MNDLKGLAGEIRAYCAHRPLTLTQSKIESYSLALADGIGVPAAAGGAYFFKELSFMFGHFAHNKFVQAGVGGPVGSEAATLLILGWAYFFLTRQYQRGSAGEGQGEEDKPMLMKKTGRLMKTAFLASLATFFLMDPPLSVTLAEQVPPAYAALIASAFSGVLHAIGTKVAQHHSNGNGNHA